MAKSTVSAPRILLAGGGSGGSVAPLLAVAEQIKALDPGAEFVLIGTKRGPERHMAFEAGLNFASIISGKLRRYWSLANFLAHFQILIGFFQTLGIIGRFKPDVAMGAGGFVQVPVLWAVRMRGVPVLIHQQDVLTSLANKLCAPIAQKITVTLEPSTKKFHSGLGFLSLAEGQKVVHTGNPVRSFIGKGKAVEARAYFGLHKDLPVVFVIGGGTGADFINNLVNDDIAELAKMVQIIHVTGRGKQKAAKHPNYHVYEFLDRVDLALAVSDIVISRAGMNLITELSLTAKVSIIIPIPNSHQESNAKLLTSKQAAVVLDQADLNPETLRKIVRAIIFEPKLQARLAKNISALMPHNASLQVAKLLLDLIK